MTDESNINKINGLSQAEIKNSRISETIMLINKTMTCFSQSKNIQTKKELSFKIDGQIQTAYQVIMQCFSQAKTTDRAAAFAIAVKELSLLSRLLDSQAPALIKNIRVTNQKILQLYESYIDYILIVLYINKEDSLVNFINIVVYILNDLTDLGLFFNRLNSDCRQELAGTRNLAENLIRECSDKMYAARIDEREQKRINQKFRQSLSYMLNEWQKWPIV